MLIECLENEGYITGFRISSSEFINARINYYLLVENMKVKKHFTEPLDSVGRDSTIGYYRTILESMILDIIRVLNIS